MALGRYAFCAQAVAPSEKLGVHHLIIRLTAKFYNGRAISSPNPY
jgi:hypothetical protein